jgi:hypothetical protein
MKSFLLGAALATCIVFSSVCQAAGSAQARQARVATGAKVPLVASSKTAAEWSARRPHFRELRPKPRGTFD